MAQEIVKPLKTKKTQRIIIGFVAGYVANYAWEQFGLFGYGKTLIPLNEKSIGVDDAILVGIGVVLYFMGYKNIAIGWILAQVVDKVIELLTE